jgi:hypothetical protein
MKHTNERTNERTNAKSAAASVPFRNNLRFFFLSLSFSFLLKRGVFVVCDKCIATGARDRLEYNTRARPDGSFAPAMDGRDPASEGEDEVQVVWHHDAAVRQLEVFVGPLYAYIYVCDRFTKTGPGHAYSTVGKLKKYRCRFMHKT